MSDPAAMNNVKAKRNLLEELAAGFDALAAETAVKLTRRTHMVEYQPPPEISAAELVRVREGLHLSRALFANFLRTNVRTLENWEQGRAKPNAQAVLLIKLVEEFPDTVHRLAAI
jgi:putative transcriptional regulator